MTYVIYIIIDDCNITKERKNTINSHEGKYGVHYSKHQKIQEWVYQYENYRPSYSKTYIKRHHQLHHKISHDSLGEEKKNKKRHYDGGYLL